MKSFDIVVRRCDRGDWSDHSLRSEREMMELVGFRVLGQAPSAKGGS